MKNKGLKVVSIIVALALICSNLAFGTVKAEETDESPELLEVQLQDLNHSFTEFSLENANGELVGAKGTVTAKIAVTGEVLGSCEIALADKVQTGKISFNRVVHAGEAIILYVNLGDKGQFESDSDVVEPCDLTAQGVVEAHAYPKAILGEVGELEGIGGTVTAKVGETTYTAKVDKEGQFTLIYGAGISYPIGTTISVEVTCIEQCSKATLNVAVEQGENTVTAIEEQDRNYPKCIFFNNAIEADETAFVQIGGKVYSTKKNYSEEDGPKISYPTQKIGTDIKVYIANDITGARSTTYSLKIVNGGVENHLEDAVAFPTSLLIEKDCFEAYERPVIVVKGVEYRNPAVIDDVYTFKYSKQAVGSKINTYVENTETGCKSSNFYVTVEEADEEDEEEDEDNDLSNTKVSNLYYGGTTLTGKTGAKAKVTAKIGKKTYKATASKKGKFTIKVPVKKIGTKVAIKIVSAKDKSNTWKKTIKVKNKSVVIKNNGAYKNSKAFSGSVTNVKKGDKIKVKIGKKTYVKKVSKNAKKLKFSFKIKKPGKNSKIQIALVNQFKQTRAKVTQKVYYAKEPKKGMTEKQVEATAWGKPNKVAVYDKETEWVYNFKAGTKYVIFVKGKVKSISSTSNNSYF